MITLFERLNIPYIVIGAMALSVWARPRGTIDIDFLILVNQTELENLNAHLIALPDCQLDTAWSDLNPLLQQLQLRVRCHGIIVDLLLPRDAHDRVAFNNRCQISSQGRNLWVSSPEDLILQKLKVGRPRDFEDALVVIEVNRDRINRTYLAEWAARLGIQAEMDFIFQQVEERENP